MGRYLTGLAASRSLLSLVWTSRSAAQNVHACGYSAWTESRQVEHILERVFTRDDVSSFVQVSGDSNPIHSDKGARALGLEAPLLPGSLLASLFPALIGSAYPGALYLTQTLSFRKSAQVGEAVIATVAVERWSGSRVKFATRIHSAGSPRALLVDGIATALIRPATAEAASAAVTEAPLPHP